MSGFGSRQEGPPKPNTFSAKKKIIAEENISGFGSCQEGPIKHNTFAAELKKIIAEEKLLWQSREEKKLEWKEIVLLFQTELGQSTNEEALRKRFLKLKQIKEQMAKVCLPPHRVPCVVNSEHVHRGSLEKGSMANFCSFGTQCSWAWIIIRDRIPCLMGARESVALETPA